MSTQWFDVQAPQTLQWVVFNGDTAKILSQCINESSFRFFQVRPRSLMCFSMKNLYLMKYVVCIGRLPYIARRMVLVLTLVLKSYGRIVQTVVVLVKVGITQLAKFWLLLKLPLSRNLSEPSREEWNFFFCHPNSILNVYRYIYV